LGHLSADVCLGFSESYPLVHWRERSGASGPRPGTLSPAVHAALAAHADGWQAVLPGAHAANTHAWHPTGARACTGAGGCSRTARTFYWRGYLLCTAQCLPGRRGAYGRQHERYVTMVI